MARETKKYSCFPGEASLQEWTVEGGTLTEYLAKTTEEGTEPSETVKLKTASEAKKIQTTKFVLPSGLKTALEAGAVVIAATVHVNAKATKKAKNLRIGFVTPELFQTYEATTTQGWFSLSLTRTQAEELSSKASLEGLVLSAEHKGESVSLFEGPYLSVEVETETARVVRSKGSAKTASGGEASITVTSSNAGDCLIVGISTGIAVAGATAVSDNQSSTYVLDAEWNDGIHPTLQVWKAKTPTAGVTEVKATGLPTTATVNLTVVETSAIGVKDTSGSGSGITTLAATEIEVSTAAKLQASKGDFAIAWFASTGSGATFTPGGSMTAISGASQTGLSVGGEYISTPAEGATFTAKGTFSAAGTWSGAVIAYKVVSSEEVFSGTAALRGGAVLKATGGKTAASTAIVTAASRMVGAGGKAGSGASTLRAGVPGSASGAKLATGSSGVRPASVLTGSGLKAAEGAPVLHGAAAQATSGSKSFRAPASVLSAARQGASGAKSATGTASVPSGGRVASVGGKLVSAVAALLAGSRVTGSGAKGGLGEGRLRTGLELLAQGTELVFAGVASLRSGGSLGATGTKSTQGESHARTAPHIAALGFKAIQGQAQTRTAAETTVQGAKAGLGEGTIRASARTGATGIKGGIGSASLRLSSRTLLTGAKTGIGHALLRAAVWLLPPEPQPVIIPPLFAYAAPVSQPFDAYAVSEQGLYSYAGSSQ
jgi:hypothetical protein